MSLEQSKDVNKIIRNAEKIIFTGRKIAFIFHDIARENNSRKN